MNDRDPRARRDLAPAQGGRGAVVGLVLVSAVVIALAVFATRSSDTSAAGASGASGADTPATTLAAPVTTAASVPETTLPDLDGEVIVGECTLTERELRPGDSGDGVSCLQAALAREGWMTGPATGSFDDATFAAVRTLQEERELFVDGVVGRETAIELGIWPDEASLVVHTPAPPAGAMDSMGYELSSVASTGSDAPPLPADSGSGRRLVYDRAGQRVWAVDDDERIIRSWLISGSKYNNETPGTHFVYSRSEESTAWNGKAKLPLMVRYLRTDIGHIGFHAIPLSVADGSKYQTEAELGTRLSGGCQRQANADARFVWAFATEGTKVVVT